MEVICFDMDNTLLHSDKVHIVAFAKAFKKNKLPKVSSRMLKSYFGLVGVVMVRKIFPDISGSKIEKVVADHDRFVIYDTAKYARLVRGTKRALKLLKLHYKMALLSNVKHIEIIALLKAVGIDINMFDVVIGNDEIKNPKPAPDAVLMAMRKVGAKRGYMVGDTIYDVRAGKAAGVKTVSVLTGDQSRSMLKKEDPDFILKSVADLPKLLLI